MPPWNPKEGIRISLEENLIVHKSRINYFLLSVQKPRISFKDIVKECHNAFCEIFDSSGLPNILVSGDFGSKKGDIKIGDFANALEDFFKEKEFGFDDFEE